MIRVKKLSLIGLSLISQLSFADQKAKPKTLDLSLPADVTALPGGADVAAKNKIPIPSRPVRAHHQLVELYTKALEIDPQMQASNQSILTAVEKSEADFALRWGPQINLSASLSYGNRYIFPAVSETIPGVNTNTGWSEFAGFTLNQPIVNFQNSAQVEQSKTMVKVAEMANAIAQQDLMMRVTTDYLNYIFLQETLERSSSEISSLTKHLEFVQALSDKALINPADLSSAMSNLATIEVDNSNYKNNLQETEWKFASAWKISPVPRARLKEKIPFADLNPNDPKKWISDAMTSNLAVQYQALLKNAAEYDYEKADKALYYPELHLTGSCSAQGVSQDLFGQDYSRSDGCSGGVVLNVPLTDGGYTRHHSAELASNVEKIQSDMDAAQVIASREAQQAYSSIQIGLSNAEKYEKIIIPQDIKSQKGMEAQYQLGKTATNLEVLSAIHNLSLHKEALLKIKIDLILNKLLLKKSVGTLSIADLEEVDNYFE